MTIKELDDKLNSPGFQDTENGDLFYNFFIYQYPAEKEYDIRRQIQEFKANLIRPVNYVDVLTLNLFEEFCNFLDQKKFLRHPSMLKYQLEKEQADPSKAKNELGWEAQYGIREMCEDSWRWQSNNPQGYEE